MHREVLPRAQLHIVKSAEGIESAGEIRPHGFAAVTVFSLVVAHFLYQLVICPFCRVEVGINGALIVGITVGRIPRLAGEGIVVLFAGMKDVAVAGENLVERVAQRFVIPAGDLIPCQFARIAVRQNVVQLCRSNADAQQQRRQHHQHPPCLFQVSHSFQFLSYSIIFDPAIVKQNPPLAKSSRKWYNRSESTGGD